MLAPIPVKHAPKSRFRKGGLYVMVAALGLAFASSLTAIASPLRAVAAQGVEGLDPENSAESILDDRFAGSLILLADDDEKPDTQAPQEVITPESERQTETETATATTTTTTTTTTTKKTRRSRSKVQRTRRSKSQAKSEKQSQARRGKRATDTPAPEQTKEQTEPVSSKSAGPDPMSADCLLNPTKCRTPEAAPTPREPSVPEVSLPSKLSAMALKSGISGTKERAKRVCKRFADPGSKVQVKLSIRGAKGTVIGAAAQGSAASTQLGTCVAEELQKSTFDRFSAPQQGLIVTVRF